MARLQLGEGRDPILDVVPLMHTDAEAPNAAGPGHAAVTMKRRAGLRPGGNTERYNEEGQQADNEEDSAHGRSP